MRCWGYESDEIRAKDKGVLDEYRLPALILCPNLLP